MTCRIFSAIVLCCALALASCDTAGDDAAAASEPEEVDSPAETVTSESPPHGPGVEVGTTYEFELYTHCGIEWARIDGTWWRTTPLDDGNANPPSGWGNPYDTGELLIVDDTTAVYRGEAGAEIEFQRTDIVDAPATCD